MEGAEGGEPAAEKVLPEVSDSDDSGPEDGPNRERGDGDLVYDFDVMIAKRKEDQSRRRKRKDIDIINDNDDLIAQLLGEMRNAAEVSLCCSYINTLGL